MRSEVKSRSVAQLTDWAGARGVPPGRLDRIFEALTRDDVPSEAGPLQKPTVFVSGLASAPWHDPADYPWTAELRAHYPAIRTEFEWQYDNAALGRHPESTSLAVAGTWSTYHFFRMGDRFERHLSACPRLARVLENVPGVDAAGMCYFSVMGPAAKVKPHCGFVNTRIRCHLGLKVPDGCEMRVGSQTRRWTEGGVLVFDDSYEHEVQNMSDEPRAVLLLDTWHPDLTVAERAALGYLMRLWRDHVD